ncbi:MAG: endodeoxyribonuclease [Podoviridae sp. ctDWo9]|nr:MAG: endodeoxyribonuclease [Podoviridae sp. ctDWo9]
MRWTQVFKTRPLAKERPRVTRYGRAYTPKRTKAYEKEIAKAYTGPFFDESYVLSVAIVCDISGSKITVTGTKKPGHKHRLKGDVDNYAKSILDGLNGVAWVDDSQIVSVTVRKV